MRTKKVQVLLAVGGLLAIGVILSLGLLLYIEFGPRSGQLLFSPESFQFRQQVVYHIPFTRGVLYRTDRLVPPPRIVEYWQNNGYLDNLQSTTTTWHLIRVGNNWDRYPGGRSIAGTFWTREFLTKGTSEWVEWSQRHPRLARKLWPVVIALLRECSKGKGFEINYAVAFHLVSFVQGSENEEEFEAGVRAWDIMCQEAPEVRELRR